VYFPEWIWLDSSSALNSICLLVYYVGLLKNYNVVTNELTSYHSYVAFQCSLLRQLPLI